MLIREYKVFISYRHADNHEEGRQWASWLHHAIETYEIPRDLVGKKNASGDLIPERIYPVFRDEEELSADAHLTSSITRALDHTEYLVIICSPQAVESTYVEAEIDYFKQIGKGDAILAMIVDGEPHSAERECFPAPLRFDRDDSGELRPSVLEPIAADFRIKGSGGDPAMQGWTTPAAYRQALEASSRFSGKQIDALVDGYRKQLELMKLKLISGILNVPLGELTRRDQAYQMERERKRARTLRRWLTGVGALALIAIAAGGLAWMQKQEALLQQQKAERQEQIATQNYSLSLTQRGLEDLKGARIERGLARLVQGLRAWPGNAVARDRLLFELAYRPWFVQLARYPIPAGIDTTMISTEEQVTNGHSSFTVEADMTSGLPRLRQEVGFFTADGRELAVSRRMEWNGEDWVAGEPVVEDLSTTNLHSVVLPDGRIVTSERNAEVEAGASFISLSGPNDELIYFEDRHGLIALSPDKSLLAVAGLNNQFPGVIEVGLYKTSAIEHSVGYFPIAVKSGADMSRLLWSGDQLLVSTTMNDGGDDSINIFDIVKEGEDLEIRPLLVRRTMNGKNWSFGNGKLYVERGEHLAVYGIAPALMRNWRASGDALSGWREFNHLEGDQQRLSEAGKQLEDTGAVSGLRARFKNSRAVSISDKSDKPQRTIEAEHPGALVPVDFTGIGFSNDESMLALSALYFRGEGDGFYIWQVLSVEQGIQLFPLSTRYDDASGPVMLRDIFLALEPVGWTQDDSAMVFKAAVDIPYSLDDEVSGDNWLVRNGATGGMYLLPLRWSNQPIPEWFLDAVSYLIHLEQDAGQGLEPVQTLAGSLITEYEQLLADRPSIPAEEGYREFLGQVIETVRQAASFTSQ